MADSPAVTQRTLDEFIQRYTETPFELLDREIVPMSPTVARHQMVSKRVFVALPDYENATHHGDVFTETPFVLVYAADWVKGSRVPEVMCITSERLTTHRAETPDWEDKPYVLGPDVAIEVVSPNDRYSDIHKKVELYLKDGVQLVCVVDPQQQHIAVHRQGSKTHTILSETDTLTTEDVLPGFKLALADIFS